MPADDVKMPADDDVFGRIEAMEKALSALAEKRKDGWDKLSALSGLISGVLIAGLGLYFTHSTTSNS
jgi:hypothetical protein